MDTAGQEQFRAVTTNYYRRADSCLLVYDITKEDTFKEIKEYFNENIKEICEKNIPVVLLGNKTDLEDQRKVPAADGINFCLENNYTFLETSCLKNQKVADAFETLIEITHRENCKNKKKDKDKNKDIKLDRNSVQRRKKRNFC